jgi:uncharacterized protein (TIGR03503 family)
VKQRLFLDKIQNQNNLLDTRVFPVLWRNATYLMMRAFCLICFVFFSSSTFAAFSDVTNPQNVSSDVGVLALGNEYQNSIKLLNNRFRIDSDIEEITIVFFREYGSAPIVLVRPDGSKLFLDNDLRDDSFNWYETDHYDMISLTNPMPGPWQAIGDILPHSRVMVIAGITLYAEPIPDLVFSGETLKQTARLENIGSDVDISLFRDVVTLSIDFVSTNNPNYPNFGLGSRQIAKFQDNGSGLDEYVADGVFTGEFDLSITEGEWRPIFTVRTPLFSREQTNENIVLRETPITLSHEIDTGELGEHIIFIKADSLYIEQKGLVVNGSVRHPTGEITKFSMTEPNATEHKHLISNTGFGIYKVNLEVFATTTTGREVILSVPEYSFATVAPVIAPEPEELDANADEALDGEVVELVEEDGSWLWIAIVVNVCILVFGILFILLLVSKRNNPDNHLSLRAKNKLMGLLSRKPKADTSPAES